MPTIAQIVGGNYPTTISAQVTTTMPTRAYMLSDIPFDSPLGQQSFAVQIRDQEYDASTGIGSLDGLVSIPLDDFSIIPQLRYLVLSAFAQGVTYLLGTQPMSAPQPVRPGGGLVDIMFGITAYD